MDIHDSLRRLRDFDAQRDSLPGEHWLTLAGGVGLWLATRNSDALAVRTLGLLGALALGLRAASGRDGVVRLLDREMA